MRAVADSSHPLIGPRLHRAAGNRSTRDTPPVAMSVVTTDHAAPELRTHTLPVQPNPTPKARQPVMEFGTASVAVRTIGGQSVKQHQAAHHEPTGR
jgi:hypothetical protein